MQIFEFEITLTDRWPEPLTLGQSQMTAIEDIANRLFDAGCDDGTPTSRSGAISIMFGRKAESIGSAIDSAMADIRNAGFRPNTLIVEELMNI